MTIQWIITIAILVATLMYAILKIVAFLKPSGRKKTSPCDSFHGDCAECLKQSGQVKENCAPVQEGPNSILTK